MEAKKLQTLPCRIITPLGVPVEPDVFPVWDYAAFSVGMLAVFLCAFGVATWFWVI